LASSSSFNGGGGGGGGGGEFAVANVEYVCRVFFFFSGFFSFFSAALYVALLRLNGSIKAL
jgi:hypothetical protein